MLENTTFKKITKINIIINHFILLQEDNFFYLYLHVILVEVDDMIKFSFHERFKYLEDFRKIFCLADSLRFFRNLSYLIMPPRKCIVTNSISIHSALIQFQ